MNAKGGTLREVRLRKINKTNAQTVNCDPNHGIVNAYKSNGFVRTETRPKESQVRNKRTGQINCFRDSRQNRVYITCILQTYRSMRYIDKYKRICTANYEKRNIKIFQCFRRISRTEPYTQSRHHREEIGGANSSNDDKQEKRVDKSSEWPLKNMSDKRLLRKKLM